MKFYWYPIESERKKHNPGRLQVMVRWPLKEGERVIFGETLGNVERARDGTWVCYAKTANGYMEYVGYETSANHAKHRVRLRYEYELEKIRYETGNS